MKEKVEQILAEFVLFMKKIDIKYKLEDFRIFEEGDDIIYLNICIELDDLNYDSKKIKSKLSNFSPKGADIKTEIFISITSVINVFVGWKSSSSSSSKINKIRKINKVFALDNELNFEERRLALSSLGDTRSLAELKVTTILDVVLSFKDTSLSVARVDEFLKELSKYYAGEDLVVVGPPEVFDGSRGILANLKVTEEVFVIDKKKYSYVRN